MLGKSKLTADAAEQAALRALSKSEQRGEADRARAILLTLEGRQAGEIAVALGVHVSTVRNWRDYFAPFAALSEIRRLTERNSFMAQILSGAQGDTTRDRRAPVATV